MHLSINTFIRPSINQSNFPPIHPSIYPSIYLSIYISINLSIHLSNYLSTYLSIYPSIFLFVLTKLKTTVFICLTKTPVKCKNILSFKLFIHPSSSHVFKKQEHTWSLFRQNIFFVCFVMLHLIFINIKYFNYL